MDQTFDTFLASFGGLPPAAFDFPLESTMTESPFCIPESRYVNVHYSSPKAQDWNFDELNWTSDFHDLNSREAPTVGNDCMQFLQHGIVPGCVPAQAQIQTHVANVQSEPPQTLTYRPHRSKPSMEAKRILERSFKMELYPDKKETQTIAARANMTFEQVRQWFRNKRRRTPPTVLWNLQAEASKESLPLTEGSLEALDDIYSLQDDDDSSLFLDGGSLYAASYHSGPSSLHRSRRRLASSRASSLYSVASSSSRVSKSSKLSKNSVPRKGRRIWQPTTAADQSKHPFLCTFCLKGFPLKYSWRRHEESVHLKSEAWVCQRPSLVDCVSGSWIACPYCSKAWPVETSSKEADSSKACELLDSQINENSSERPLGSDILPNAFWDHLDNHSYLDCVRRTEEERTYYRKEHAKQHATNCHGANRLLLTDERFSRLFHERKDMPAPSLLACPFCKAQCTDWPSRVDHVARHFTQGDILPVEATWLGYTTPCGNKVERVVALD